MTETPKKIVIKPALRMHRLFAGRDTAHGVFRPGKQKKNERNKVKGGQATELGPATPLLWEKHLRGEEGLGVFMLRLDGMVRFGAIDVDIYSLDHAPLARKIAKAKLPLVVCRSKSGGAHLYLFGKEDLPAGLVRKKLAEWAVLLDLYGLKQRKEDKVEFFPHKSQLAGENDFGKYLNMPYFKENGGERWGVAPGGRVMPTLAFLDYAEKLSVTVKELEEFKSEVDSTLVDGPPCLQTLCGAGPIGEFRNNVLLNLGVYLRQRFPDDWKEKLEEYNRKLIDPPLPAKEIVALTKSVGKAEYNYTCKQEPIEKRCNSTVCITRKYGVRAKAEDNGHYEGFTLNLGQLTKFDTIPPTWELEVNGKVINLTTDQWTTYRLFRKAVLEYRNIYPPQLTDKAWFAIIQDKMSSLETAAAPDDAGEPGRVRWYLEQYCLNNKTRTRDELKDNRAWWDEENGHIYFRLHPLLEFLHNHRVFIQPREITSFFRAWGFLHGQYNIKGVCVQWWKLPEFKTQTEPDEIPRPGRDNVSMS
jgi:hypothetical protein